MLPVIFQWNAFTVLINKFHDIGIESIWFENDFDSYDVID